MAASVRQMNPRRAAAQPHLEQAATGKLQGKEFRQGRERYPSFTVNNRPERSRHRGRRLGLENGDTQPACGRLHRVEERAEIFNVVTHMGDKRDISFGRVRHGPAALHLADVRDVMLRHPFAQDAKHRIRRIEGDDFTGQQGDGKRVPASPAPMSSHVSPGCTSSRRASSAGSPVRRGSARNADATGA